MDDQALFQDMPDLTCNSQEFIDLGMGDDEEHAILLCNYFNYIDDRQKDAENVNASRNEEKKHQHYESFILYGEAMPRGITYWVARLDKKNHCVELWDPLSGMCYFFSKDEKVNASNKDPICPLKKIWALVGIENVWVNIDNNVAPALINYDLKNENYWKPFIVENSEMKTDYVPTREYVQKKKLDYLPPKIEYVEKMEGDLKKYLTRQFNEKRLGKMKKTTNWNHNISEDIKKILRADKDVVRNYRDDVKAELNPRLGGKQAVKDMMKKHFDRVANQSIDVEMVLTEFETYMQNARRTGVSSTMRIRDDRKEPDDIRSFLVQQFLGRIADAQGKSLIAVPINVSLGSNLNEIWSKVEATRMHEIDLQDAEFSLSVMITAYPSNVFSVWIYVACFKDQKDDKLDADMQNE